MLRSSLVGARTWWSPLVFGIALAFAFGVLQQAAWGSEPGAAKVAADPNVKERIEQVLVERWAFFKKGDTNRDGFIDVAEFHAHPTYKQAGWGVNVRTFIFWMVDDDKDQRVSLQEWFNNEIGQFQMADRNHDGIIDAREYDAIGDTQKRLFKDLGYAP